MMLKSWCQHEILKMSRDEIRLESFVEAKKTCGLNCQFFKLSVF